IAAGYESQYDLIEAVGEPNCLALFDAWAPALHGADLPAAARKMAPVTFHTTIANYQFRPRYRYEPAVVNYAPQTPAVQAVAIGGEPLTRVEIQIAAGLPPVITNDRGRFEISSAAAAGIVIER